MGKQLVGRDNVGQYICHEERKLYVDQTMILSPGGKDYLREKGITIVYGRQPGKTENPAANPPVKPGTDLTRTIQEILKRDYAITDSSQAAEITREVLSRLKNEQ